MEAWIAKVSVIKFEEMHQFQYIGCVLPSIQKLVCFFWLSGVNLAAGFNKKVSPVMDTRKI